ncbi:unnamed protein product [Paramecium sonneborni]|uniref:Protein kinase domain-containing protein n=1 Tax=Paramecium sonneborni TaxID=65129 RepID=A0A8S1QV40_9CILI|nr:unnamed protein product [Paramecium sonneborni]
MNKQQSIGQYVFGKTLGEGTFGKVKLATHQTTQEKVAIKILEKSKIVDTSDIERVTREIQILKQIRHPNLVQLYEKLKNNCFQQWNIQMVENYLITLFKIRD